MASTNLTAGLAQTKTELNTIKDKLNTEAAKAYKSFAKLVPVFIEREMTKLPGDDHTACRDRQKVLENTIKERDQTIALLRALETTGSYGHRSTQANSAQDLDGPCPSGAEPRQRFDNEAVEALRLEIRQDRQQDRNAAELFKNEIKTGMEKLTGVLSQLLVAYDRNTQVVNEL
ncbi:hypothetical protein OQA88_12430 [Cercophora sp. LCS_1]